MAKLWLLILALATAGCSALPPPTAMDAVPEISGGGLPVVASAGQRVTARDWNCKRCY